MLHHGAMTETDVPRTARQRVRAEVLGEIKAVAREHLREHGSGALSLRAVARDVGMVSSAVYRYFPSRDELLTALIVDAYSDFGRAVTEAERAVRRSDLIGRWMAATRGARRWAIAEPHQYALIFGSPIPGYAAPEDTVDPAAITPLVLLAIVADGAAGGRSARPSGPHTRSLRSDLRRLAAAAAPGVSDDAVDRGVMAYSQLIGAISFELFGHLHNVISDLEAYFDHQMRSTARDLGLVS
jgi:AcrR family transcriptional regulator